MTYRRITSRNTHRLEEESRADDDDVVIIVFPSVNLV